MVKTKIWEFHMFIKQSLFIFFFWNKYWLITIPQCRPDYMYPNTLVCHLFPHRECCRFFGDDGLTPRVFFTKVAPFGLLWILTNYLYLQALRKINTTDASALFCCNKAFVFLLSWIVLRDRFMGVRVSPSVPVTHKANTNDFNIKQQQQQNGQITQRNEIQRLQL